jgi:hypothetical protein
MAVLSQNLIDEILDVARTYEAKELQRIERLVSGHEPQQPSFHAPDRGLTGDTSKPKS